MSAAESFATEVAPPRPVLSSRQQSILDFIRSFIAANGFPPTLREICNAMGFKSTNAAAEHLRSLEKRGYIEISNQVSRGIRVVGPGGGARTGPSVSPGGDRSSRRSSRSRHATRRGPDA